jgi:acetoin utilization deacetylase AcuC-like enzyme
MKTTAYVTHSDCSLHDTGWAHPEHQGRLPAIARVVYRDMLTLFDPLLEIEAVHASEADLRLAHTEGYIRAVRRRVEESARAGEVLPLDGGTVVSGSSWAAATAAVGAALTAIGALLRGEARNAFCATRPPGHGVGRERPDRFGIFNPVAIAARVLLERHGLARVLVLDWGAHPGTGTLDILLGDPRVTYVGLAGEALRTLPPPHRLAHVAADAAGPEIAAALEHALDRAIADGAPEFLLLSMGCDALASDPSGRFRLDPADYFVLTETVRTRADAVCGGRLVSVLEEGYDASGTGAAVLHHLRALAALPRP